MKRGSTKSVVRPQTPRTGIGAAITHYRTVRGLTQAELAAAIDVSQGLETDEPPA